MRYLLALVLIAACGSPPPLVTIDGPPGSAPLTVKNVPSHAPYCSISVNGAASSQEGTQTVNVTPGPITLVATPANSSFSIGPTTWHDTDGDTGAGDPGTLAGAGATETSTAIITVTAAGKCVWACCPIASGGTGCPTTDQCP